MTLEALIRPVRKTLNLILVHRALMKVKGTEDDTAREEKGIRTEGGIIKLLITVQFLLLSTRENFRL